MQSGLETNIFPIQNLDELSSRYRLYKIRGLRPEQDEYYQNVALLKRRLSYALKTPVTVIVRESLPYLVVKDDQEVDLSSPYVLVRTPVRFERCAETFDLDYTLRSSENDEICLRFLQFIIQEPLRHYHQLWQSGSGLPFFLREPLATFRGINHYRGFSVRAVVTPQGGLGLCLDVSNRFVSQKPLSANLTRDQFRHLKGRTCLYHYGSSWFDIRPDHISDESVSEQLVVVDGEAVPLIEFVARACSKPLPPEVAHLAHDAAVVVYKNNQGEDRSAPAPLCHLVYDTHDDLAGLEHGRTILAPEQRHRLIDSFANSFLRNLNFGTSKLRVSREALSTPYKMFVVPDYLFGNGQILSVRGTAGAHQSALDQLGSKRMALLRDASAGFYSQGPLGRQYFVMAQSVYDSYGVRELADIKQAVNDLFPQGEGYDPEVILYDDRKSKTFVHQGKAILDAVDGHGCKPGYAAVMIHNTADQRLRKEDQLAAMVVREFRQRGITAAVLHTAMGRECYELRRYAGHPPQYEVRPNQRSKFTGYLRGVALNTVLLTNQRWPFALATPLHADVVIGVDVKHRTAGLIVLGSNGATVRTIYKTSMQKERLLREQFCAYFVEIIRMEASTSVKPLTTILTQRDGKLFASEREGAGDAMKLLRQENTLPGEATLTITEIPKKEPVSLRLFDVTRGSKDLRVQNPQIGSYYAAGPSDGYLCATGRAFRRKGSVHPLHVYRVEGPMSIEECLEDLYFLTSLAWTRPEDCTRDPITTKLNDRFLGEEATEYNTDALAFHLPEAEEI